MDDLRWFAPNRYCTLPVPALRSLGLRIALDGDAPAGAAVAADGQSAVAAFEYALATRCPLLTYLWDLPPWRLGRGKPDLIFHLGGRLRRIPRPLGGFPERAGNYSRIRYVAQRAAMVWSPSESTVRDVRARFAVDAERVPFCYDSDRFGPESRARNAGSRDDSVILSISRLVPHKNHAVILRAAARLESRPLVRIIGQGSEADPLRRLARDLGVTLDLPGTWVSDQEVVEAYRNADVVVSPSRFEGFGLTPMEGLVMGLPVIASDIPPHREFMGEAVRYFPPDDEISLARELSDVLAGRSIRDLAPPAVLSDLTIEACARRFLPGLERLLRSRQ